MNGNNLSYEASVNNLKRFFANTEGDRVTPKQIYLAAGRDLSESAKNKSWLSNKTHAMGEHGLFVKKYAKDGFHEFNSLELTEKGKKALGRTRRESDMSDSQLKPTHIPGSYVREVTLSTVRRDIENLRLKEPELDILFDVKLKETPLDR